MAMKMGLAAFASGFFLFLLGTQAQSTYPALSSVLYMGAIAAEGLAVVLFWRGK